jgi:hypothetical protein
MTQSPLAIALQQQTQRIMERQRQEQWLYAYRKQCNAMQQFADAVYEHINVVCAMQNHTLQQHIIASNCNDVLCMDMYAKWIVRYERTINHLRNLLNEHNVYMHMFTFTTNEHERVHALQQHNRIVRKYKRKYGK